MTYMLITSSSLHHRLPTHVHFRITQSRYKSVLFGTFLKVLLIPQALAWTSIIRHMTILNLHFVQTNISADTFLRTRPA